LFFKLFLNFFGYINQNVVLYKYKIVDIVWYNKVLKKGKIRVSRVLMLL
jgi:hypothetical protein